MSLNMNHISVSWLQALTMNGKGVYAPLFASTPG